MLFSTTNRTSNLLLSHSFIHCSVVRKDAGREETWTHGLAPSFTSDQALPTSHPTFGHVLGQGFDVIGGLLPRGVRVQVSAHALHLLLKGSARTLLCALKVNRETQLWNEQIPLSGRAKAKKKKTIKTYNNKTNHTIHKSQEQVEKAGDLKLSLFTLTKRWLKCIVKDQ